MPVITTTTYICDGCGMEIAEGHFTMRLDHGSQYDGEHYEYVYCIPCCRIIRQALDELPHMVGGKHDRAVAKDNEG